MSRALVCAIAVLLAACSEELMTDLDQRAANEVEAVLRAGGVAVDRLPSGGRWTISVPRAQRSRASTLAAAAGLPRPSLDLAARAPVRPLVPSAGDERRAHAYALERDVIAALLNLPGVYEADAHVQLPEPTRSLGATAEARPSATLTVVQVVGGAPIPDDVIVALALGTIDGLQTDDVTVVRAEVDLPAAPAATPARVGPFVVASESAMPLRLSLGLAAALLVATGAISVRVGLRRDAGAA